MSGRRFSDPKAEAGGTTAAPAALRALVRLLARQVAGEWMSGVGKTAPSNTNPCIERHRQSALARLDDRGVDEE
jgi:hypothetical protein